MEAALAIRPNYLQFDSTSSLLGFGLAACPPPRPPPVYSLGLLRKLERTQGRGGSTWDTPRFLLSPAPGRGLWAMTLIKVL